MPDFNTLAGEELDFWMYKYAASVVGKEISESHFKAEYPKGGYQFSKDPSLLNDLLLEHSMRLQMLGEDWLASTESISAFGSNPLEAACRLVVKSYFGS